jgi:2-polyprenyl-3-methyl-5-hydroxy-6-metoxy-1,4-benzoquinol methylase
MITQEARSYYESQSFGRDIKSASDVANLATQESSSYDLAILPFLGRPEQCRIYEAATGPGILQSWLKARSYQNVEGSDMSGTEAAIAASINPNVQHADSLAHLGSFTDGSFDAIVALDFLEHIPREDFRRFLDIAFAKLVPSGVLIMRGPNGDSPFVGLNLYNDPTHIWCYTSTSLTVLHRLAGFSQIELADDTEHRFGNARGLKRLVRRTLRWTLAKYIKASTGITLRYFGTSLYSYARKAP